MSYPPPQFPPNFHHPYPRIFNPFGAQPNYPQFSFTQGYPGSSYQGAVGVGQHPRGGSEASPVGSIAFFQGSRATDSRGDESSPIGSASPVSQEQQLGADPVEAAVWSERSESSPDELEKREGRVHWGQEENLRLVSAWIKHSTDPVVGVDRRGDRYWKDVAAEYNMHAPKQQRRSATQCKNHWQKTIPFITKFNACYDKAKREHVSGESDDQVIERAREEYKGAAKKKRPFALEYWWKAVKDQPKWSKAYPIEEMMNKRSRLNESGAYTSSNPESEDADPSSRCRPLGRNAAKAQQKNKGKLVYSEDSISNDNVQQFNELQLRKTIAAEKMAEATLVQAEAAKTKAEADNKMADAEKDKTKLQKLEMYMVLLRTDTSGYDERTKAGHDQMLALLAKDLFS